MALRKKPFNVEILGSLFVTNILQISYYFWNLAFYHICLSFLLSHLPQGGIVNQKYKFVFDIILKKINIIRKERNEYSKAVKTYTILITRFWYVLFMFIWPYGRHITETIALRKSSTMNQRITAFSTIEFTMNWKSSGN